MTYQVSLHNMRHTCMKAWLGYVVLAQSTSTVGCGRKAYGQITTQINLANRQTIK